MSTTTNVLLGQTKVQPGFNVFSVDQDVEIGRQSAGEVERQLPILRDASAQQYVSRIGQRLAAAAPGAKYPYQFKVVNVSDVNAFALPGGFMYINRGLIETAQNEGQLAGVMAHEMSHVALRHGTNQASKAYLAQAGLGVLGGLFGGGNMGQIIGAVGGFGLNAVFLKFSRNAEQQADIVGSQIMAKAGYDPIDMVKMFQILEQKAGREPSKLERFFSDHPAPGDRANRIEEEAKLLNARPQAPVGDFRQVRASLNSMPPASSMQAVASHQQPSGTSSGRQQAGTIQIERPSGRFKTFEPRNGLFQIQYPDNWKPYESEAGVTLLPNGGSVETDQGNQIVYGVIVSHYVPFEGSMGSVSRQGGTSRQRLQEATQDLLNQLSQNNSHLRVSGSARPENIDGREGLSVLLTGDSPVTGKQERVQLFTRELNDQHVVYCLFIAPGESYGALNSTFERMIGSLRVDENTRHEAQK
jgi:hypothetical protein